ncbi:hypothetical protein LX97_01498 [Nonlabens dokdonensis]|jgi:uncharacterized protein Smg (DUF494 family)|uniref:Uncharacterized protein n=2 Tax=Nonlabens dokdonensis TaxID=328515 RepID=L7W9Q6_NONDD|nr:hypothetical protein [Nonlabens dokdonensis]AGC76839.1 hypothetical protein DDD_1712 [Nonlabens dokdonensis DSW-6]PZX44480.1 hypothetical protein LX97_01498 [Nonlabens dokdonensis]
MSEKLAVLKDKLEDRHHVFMVYKSQVNKDLERSGFNAIEINEPQEFLDELISLLNEAMEDSDPKLQQLYYLADVQEKNLEHGIILGFLMREWSKIQFRLRQ